MTVAVLEAEGLSLGSDVALTAGLVTVMGPEIDLVAETSASDTAGFDTGRFFEGRCKKLMRMEPMPPVIIKRTQRGTSIVMSYNFLIYVAKTCMIHSLEKASETKEHHMAK